MPLLVTMRFLLWLLGCRFRDASSFIVILFIAVFSLVWKTCALAILCVVRLIGSLILLHYGCRHSQRESIMVSLLQRQNFENPLPAMRLPLELKYILYSTFNCILIHFVHSIIMDRWSLSLSLSLSLSAGWGSTDGNFDLWSGRGSS